jgi:hypothetical protein
MELDVLNRLIVKLLATPFVAFDLNDVKSLVFNLNDFSVLQKNKINFVIFSKKFNVLSVSEGMSADCHTGNFKVNFAP